MELTTNIRVILDKLLRHPLMLDLSFETTVDYTIDFMRLVGVPSMYLEKTLKIKVINYRALLPCDFYEMIQVRNTEDNIAFRYATNSFHLSEDKNNATIGYSYKILGNVIFTSIKDGEIEIAYRAIAIDDEGYPLLPDNSSFTRALSAYIKKEWFTILFDMNKINGLVLLNAQLEYAWAVGDCTNEFNRLSLDKAESLFNSWRTLLIKDKEHVRSFLNLGARQIIKTH